MRVSKSKLFCDFLEVIFRQVLIYFYLVLMYSKILKPIRNVTATNFNWKLWRNIQAKCSITLWTFISIQNGAEALLRSYFQMLWYQYYKSSNEQKGPFLFRCSAD